MIIMLPELIAGIALLILGRRLFWLFVAGVGFLSGLALAPRLFANQPQTMVLIISLGLGILGAVLALVFQRIAVALAGLLLGGYIGLVVGHNLGLLGGGLPDWLLFVAGAVIGVILITTLFNWALILLSTIAGAGMILDSLRHGPRTLGLPLITGGLSTGTPLTLLLFIVLLLVGLIVQARQLRRA